MNKDIRVGILIGLIIGLGIGVFIIAPRLAKKMITIPNEKNI